MVKALKLILVIFLVLILATGGVFGFLQYQKFNQLLASKDNEIQELQKTIALIGDLGTAYVLRSDVKAGKEVQESDLEPVDIPLSMSGSLITNLKDIKDKYYKLDLTQGTALSSDMIMSEQLEDSMRLYDVVTDENPIGLTVGKYVDIRISMPLGEDFVAMSHKRVYGINNGILKLALSEMDIHTYNSMLVDKILYPGTRIYAVEYVQPSAQQPAERYYPLSKNILEIVQKDPNLASELRPDILARRNQLEESLKVVMDAGIAKAIQKGKTEITKEILASEKELQKQLEAEAKAAEKAAKKQVNEDKEGVVKK